ncbi:MAG: type I DNA topoisomerase, partial [Acidimicrobiales bacterium]
MPKPLVIVESPAKARKIAEFLGRDYAVEASVGHIRDLPHGAAEVPAAYKKEPWARLGVDTENDFKPLYIVPKEKKEQVKKLKNLLKDADVVYLATDEDREGESISWHLCQVLNPRVPVKRMVFHEITKKAIDQAVANCRDVDVPLVDAQETRRILDRLYGYEISPVLWKKVLPRLSAGRVQSVATRIVVERERERMAFRPAGYWGLDATLIAEAQAFPAALVALDEAKVATGRDFDQQGNVRGQALVLDEPQARALATAVADRPFAVRSVEEKPYRSSPKPPFITSTLQQEAGRKLRFTSKRAMQAAQRLYENGYITYMRTDSTALSVEATAAARSLAASMYGPEYVPAQPRNHSRKVKNAQEAHEAIRPAGETFRKPDEVAREVGADEAALYDLIWKRTVASQMADATGSTVSVRLAAVTAEATPRTTEWASSGRTITFPGYMRAYVEGSDDPEGKLEDRQVILPPLREGQEVAAEAVEASGHTTSPPARYTEASLVAKLEELGVGRPSTYASIMETIQYREYVWKKGSALVPTWTAFAVINLMEQHFPHLVDYSFTAKLEDDLDAIASKEAERVPWLTEFYFGSKNGSKEGQVAQPGLKELVSSRLTEIDPKSVNSIPVGDGIVVRVGRYGPYLERDSTGERASLPDDVVPDELTVERAQELLALGNREDEPLGVDPETGLEVYVKTGRFGAYVQLGEQEEGSKVKPKRASLFKGMHPDHVTLEQALQLLSLPRVLGGDPTTGEEITAQNGRFGPYLKRGTDSRTLPSEELLLMIDLEEALVIYAKPKYGKGSRTATPPLRELGADPATGAPVVVKEGQYGTYLTDGETNVTLKDGWEELTLGQAGQLLADKRAAGPTQKRPRKR